MGFAGTSGSKKTVPVTKKATAAKKAGTPDAKKPTAKKAAKPEVEKEPAEEKIQTLFMLTAAEREKLKSLQEAGGFSSMTAVIRQLIADAEE